MGELVCATEATPVYNNTMSEFIIKEFPGGNIIIIIMFPGNSFIINSDIMIY